MPVTENFHSSDVHSGFLGGIPVHPIFWVTALRAPSSSIDWITLNSHPCCDFHPCADMEDSFTSGLHERFAICRTSPHFNRLGFRIHCFLTLKKKLLKRILFAAMTTWPTRSGMLSTATGKFVAVTCIAVAIQAVRKRVTRRLHESNHCSLQAKVNS